MKKSHLAMLLLAVAFTSISCKKEVQSVNPIISTANKGTITIKSNPDFLAIKALEVQMEVLEVSVPLPQTKYQGLCNKRILLLQSLLKSYPELKTYKQEQIESTFGYITALRGGDCQSAYTGEIKGCDNSFYVASTFAVIAGAFTSFFATPIVGVGVGAAGIASATGSHFSCVMSAFHTRQVCQTVK